MISAPTQKEIPPLKKAVTTLYGIGPERAKLLEKLEIKTIEDLLLYGPSRYEDRQQMCRISELEVGKPAITFGKIVAQGTSYFRQRMRSVFEIVLEDGAGRLHCRWWNQPFMEKKFQKGDEVLVFGKPVQLKPRTINHPETEILEGGEENFVHLNRLTPIYPLIEGLPQRWLRSLTYRTVEMYAGNVPEPYPAELIEKTRPDLGLGFGARGWLPSRAQAIRMIHFPEAEEQIEAARRRLALDEFVALQIQMQNRRASFENKAQALPCGGDKNRLVKPFLHLVGFKLTNAQAEVLKEIRADLAGAHPMRRLLQGDVGSGKTVVAACSALMTLECGFEVALMAPTEILAEQHYLNFSKWFGPLGIEVELRTGSHKPSPSALNGSPAPLRMTIGTHALIKPGFAPERLGLVIIDEQHKFGVAQREELVRKGRYPHLLVMTATPIPRTLGLTLYGDLDLSTIMQMPEGRGRLQTFVRTRDGLAKVWDFVRAQLSAGRQAYIVYPRVEVSGGADDVKAVTKEFGTLQQKLEPYRVGLLHGKVAAREKEHTMAAFRDNKVQVLLATSLIEVGVDMPNATVMVIENAEQFGLAQLHQLRGRIGRGAKDSYCVLVTSAKTTEAKQRLSVLERTRDGFEIAEADLKLRGPGELLGRQQSGMPRFRFGDLARDIELIQQAKKMAHEMASITAAAKPVHESALK